MRGDFIILPRKLRFEPAKRGLLPDGVELLKDLAAFLALRDDLTHISIEGHSAHQSPSRALRLAKRRATEVIRILSTFGVGRQRLTAKSFGDEVPLVPPGRPGSADINRRMEFRIVDRMPAPDVPLP